MHINAGNKKEFSPVVRTDASRNTDRNSMMMSPESSTMFRSNIQPSSKMQEDLELRNSAMKQLGSHSFAALQRKYDNGKLEIRQK